MGRIGYTYGSEWQLLRYLGYHRDDLSRAVEDAIPGSKVLRWLDHRYRKDDRRPDPGCYSRDRDIPGRPPALRRLDRELRAIEFLDPDELARVGDEWTGYWPQTGTPPNWDAVAQLEIDGRSHWLLVEAKSHLDEITAFCNATEPALGVILQALTQTIQNVDANVDPQAWLGPYYQLCNRLAVLNFLVNHDIPTKLLFVYFLGDLFPSENRVCPTAQQEWMPLLQAMENHVGWTDHEQNRLRGCVHKLFLPVWPGPVQGN